MSIQALAPRQSLTVKGPATFSHLIHRVDGLPTESI